MTFESYTLPKGAPQRVVWFAICDVCHEIYSGPYGETLYPQSIIRADIEQKGWRYQYEHPRDTCPQCLDIPDTEGSK
jgi:hypothetical protein